MRAVVRIQGSSVPSGSSLFHPTLCPRGVSALSGQESSFTSMEQSTQVTPPGIAPPLPVWPPTG